MDNFEGLDDVVRMDKTSMMKYLSLLNAKLRENEESGEIIIFGGAVMCLVFGSRGYTRDIDAVFEPKTSMNKYIKEIAEDIGLPKDWLNDGVKGWLYNNPQTELVHQFSNLTLLSATADYLLAMKCHAARMETDDLEDAKFLKNFLGLNDYNEVLNIVEQYIPHKFLSTKTVAFAQELFL